MMPPTEIKTVTVLRDTRGNLLRESNPNLVLFQPHCSLKNTKSSVRVHFDQVPKKTRPQSAHVYPQYEPIKVPRPQKIRPQSAKPMFSIPKARPISAVSYKSTSSTDISDIISELSKNLNEVIVEDAPRMKRRVWRPKKKGDGIHHTPAPPPPIRAKWTTDRTKSEVKPTQSKRRQNDLAWVRNYKYGTNFHSYDKFSKGQLNLLRRTGVPDFLKKYPVYGHSAAKQKCCYRPSKSVTHVDHHHRVGSVPLPHPARAVETPPPTPHYPPVEILPAEEEEEGGEEEEQGELINNGSFAYTYQGDEEKNYVYGSEEEDDKDRTYETERTTDHSRQYSEDNNDDLYFLSSNQKDTNKNNNRVSDLSQTEANLSGTFTKNDLLGGQVDNESYKSVREADEDTDGMYDFDDDDDDDDGLYDDIPEIPSDIEDALDKYKPKKSNRPQSAAKFRSRADDSGSEAQQVDSD